MKLREACPLGGVTREPSVWHRPRVRATTQRATTKPAATKKVATAKAAPRKKAATEDAVSEKRVRRTAEDARSAILDAANKRMAEVGPGGLRLQDVAADVGVSHPTILHHFGSREGLVAAVVHRAIDELHASLVEEIGKDRRGEKPVLEMLEAAARVLGPMGHARVVAWLSLSGEISDTRGADNLEMIARAAHEVRRQHHGEDTPPYEDMYFVIILSALALFGDVVVGPMLYPPEDASQRERRGKRFRAWLAKLLQSHLERGEAEMAAARKSKNGRGP